MPINLEIIASSIALLCAIGSLTFGILTVLSARRFKKQQDEANAELDKRLAEIEKGGK